jgi:tRNA-binding protein
MSGRMAQHSIDPAGRPYDPAGLPRKPDVGGDGFFALDLRVGRVVDVSPFPEARKPAWKLTVDFGPVVGTLQTSAQVTNYPASSLEGRLVVGAINLGRKRIAGFASEFLVLGALDPDGTVRLLELPDGVEPGAPVA